MTTKNLTGYFNQTEWNNGGGPFDDQTLRRLGLKDITQTREDYIDACSSGDILGFYLDADNAIWRADLESGDEVWLTQI